MMLRAFSYNTTMTCRHNILYCVNRRWSYPKVCNDSRHLTKQRRLSQLLL